MHEFFRSFKKIYSTARNRSELMRSKWSVLLLSIPFIGFLFKAGTAEAAGAKGGALGAIASTAVSSVGQLIGASAEAGATLLIWIFIINQLSEIVSDIAGGIFLFLINFLIGVSQYNSFLGSSVVTIGWSVTRDFANMFLVVALLVIAFGTILNVNGYQATNLLKQFLFAAVLVNFSKTICGVLIDLSQVVMMTFVSGYSETAAGNFITMFQVEKWLQLAIGNASDQLGQANIQTSTMTGGAATFLADAAGNLSAMAANFFAGTAANVFTAIIAFIGVIAVLSLDIILVVRIVTLWFLIVASPLAFVAKVLPVTKGFSSKWWHAFNQQLVAGPVVAFIVWISLASISVSDTAFNVINQAGQGDKLFAETNAASNAIVATKISSWESLALYFVPIVIFIMGAKWAVSLSGGFAKSIAGMASKRVGGLGRSMFSKVGRAAFGKGAFSVPGTFKRSMAGERGGFSSFVGDAAGVADRLTGSRMSGLATGLAKRGGAVGKGAGLIGAGVGMLGMTAAGRAKKYKNYKDLKVAYSKAGLGEYGAKRKEAQEDEARAQLYAEEARTKFEYYSNKAKETGITPQQKAEFEELALGYKNQYETKSKAARKPASDKQKALFELEGMTDPIVLLHNLKNQDAVSQLELDVAEDLINTHYEKEESKRIAKAKAAAGANWANESAATTERIKGEVAAESSQIKSRLSEVVKKKNKDILGANEDERRQKIETEAGEYRKSFVDRTVGMDPYKKVNQLAGTWNVSMKDAHNPQRTEPERTAAAMQANDEFARAIGDEMTHLVNRGDDVKPEERERLVTAAIGRVPLQERNGLLDALKREAERRVAQNSNDVELGKVVEKISNLNTNNEENIKKYTTTIEAKLDAHVQKNPGITAYYSPDDLGMKKTSDGNYAFDTESLFGFQGAIAKDPTIIAKLNTQVLNSPEVKAAIGGAITNPSLLKKVIKEMYNVDGGKGKGDTKRRAAAVFEGAIQANRSDTATADAMNRLKDGYFRTVASRDVDPFASGQPRPTVGPSPVSGQAPSGGQASNVGQAPPTTGSSPAAGNTAPSNGQTQDPASSEPDIDTTG